MLIGSASRYIGGGRAVQTVYWRVSKRNEKLVKTGKNFNLNKPATEEPMRTRYAGRITSCGGENAAKFV